MKTFIFLSILFSAIAFPAFGGLTDADLDKIRLIVKEEIKAEIATVRQEIKAETALVRQELKEDIATSEKNIKEYVTVQTGHLEKSLSIYSGLLYIFMPLIVAAMGIPTAIMAWCLVKEKEHSLEKQVEILTQEIETLKRQQIIHPRDA